MWYEQLPARLREAEVKINFHPGAEYFLNKERMILSAAEVVRSGLFLCRRVMVRLKRASLGAMMGQVQRTEVSRLRRNRGRNAVTDGCEEEPEEET